MGVFGYLVGTVIVGAALCLGSRLSMRQHKDSQIGSDSSPPPAPTLGRADGVPIQGSEQEPLPPVRTLPMPKREPQPGPKPQPIYPGDKVSQPIPEPMAAQNPKPSESGEYQEPGPGACVQYLVNELFSRGLLRGNPGTSDPHRLAKMAVENYCWRSNWGKNKALKLAERLCTFDAPGQRALNMQGVNAFLDFEKLDRQGYYDMLRSDVETNMRHVTRLIGRYGYAVAKGKDGSSYAAQAVAILRKLRERGYPKEITHHRVRDLRASGDVVVEDLNLVEVYMDWVRQGYGYDITRRNALKTGQEWKSAYAAALHAMADREFDRATDCV